LSNFLSPPAKLEVYGLLIKKKIKAVSYLYNCGATADFSTQVSILNFDEPIETSGNVFITKGKNNIIFRWASNDELLVYVNKNWEIFKQKNLDHINLNYK